MPIGNITQTISELPAAGARGVDVQTIFVIKQEDFQDHLQGTTVTELNTLKDQLNIRIGEINSTTTTMNGYANTASAGASTATTKAGEASTSASEALTSRNQASTFATNSSNSATKASQWADNNYNVEVETGKYSAKHWSTVAQNATSNKVDKVISTDNAIVRFDGVAGAVQNSNVIIDDNGKVLVTSGTGGFGYGTGSGGTVTQLTSKSTAVTLNKPTGRIILSNSAINSGGTVFFSFQNSTIEIKDIIAVNTIGASYITVGAYSVKAEAISTGQCYIVITNNTGITLSESVQLSFTVTKGSYS